MNLSTKTIFWMTVSFQRQSYSVGAIILLLDMIVEEALLWPSLVGLSLCVRHYRLTGGPAPECRPKAGKRRRACKDCTCGLAQKLQEEDAVKRADADEQLDAMRLLHDDLAEVDFTVQGKVGSCGNCSLGDAFRCEV